MQLSLYGKTNDRFWFTFFHEVAHILLHDKHEIFLDACDSKDKLDSKQDQEADDWARDFLIPPQYAHELRSLRS
ncbi:MAG: ImmA/IrrE family metallo-endopeptidase, partial [Synechococcus sp.]